MTKTLSKIQTELKAPKGQFNAYGKYHYRSCENILEALKPLLEKYEVALTISDEMVAMGTKVYVKATATLRGADGEISVSAYAREADVKKGMDDSQITGATSSYARKYALNGLFAIDDTKDADDTNTHGKDEQQQQPQRQQQPSLTAEQFADITQLLELTATNTNDFLNYFKVNEIAKVPFEKAREILVKKLEKIKKAG